MNADLTARYVYWVLGGLALGVSAAVGIAGFVAYAIFGKNK